MIKKGSNVKILTGKDKGKDGEIIQMGDIATDRLKTNLALPTEITEKDL